MADMSEGVPAKVWDKALQLGLHNDCLVAQESCRGCDSNLMLAFEFYYGDADSQADVMASIVEDLTADFERALRGT